MTIGMRPQEIIKSNSAPRTAFWLLGMTIVLAPLPLGSDRPLAWTALELTVGLLLLFQALCGRLEFGVFRRTLALPEVFGAVVVAYVVIQILPWTPTAWWNPLWDQAATTLGRTSAGAIAIDRQAALSDLARLFLYAAVFILALLLGRDRQRAALSIRLVAAAGTAYALFGLAVFWSGSRTVLWLMKSPYPGDVTGPFVNHNSFATYLGLCLLAALGHVVTTSSSIRLHGRGRRRFEAAVEFASRHWAMVLSPFVLATALLLTQSRGGMLAAVGGLFALALAVAAAPSLGRWRRFGWIVLPVTLVLLAFYVSGGLTMERLMDANLDADERLAVYRLTLQAIGDYLFQGTGLGSFAAIFPVYRTSAIHAYYDMGHNDYLQTVLELGLPVALCMFGILAALAASCVRGIRRRQRDAIFPAIGLAATVLVALHSTVDFSLQIPAVTVTYAFLLGVAVAQSRSSRPASTSSVRDAPAPGRTPPDAPGRPAGQV